MDPTEPEFEEDDFDDEEFERPSLISIIPQMLFMLTIIGGFAAFVFYSMFNHQELFMQVMGYGALVGLIASPFLIFIFVRLFRSMSPKNAVLWLRRFHNHDPARFPMPKLFSRVGISWFQVLTIQDSSVRFSMVTGYQRSLGAYIFLLVLLVLPAFLFGLVGAALTFNVDQTNADTINSWWFSAAIIGFMLLFMAMVLVPTMLVLARRRGVETLRAGNAERKIEKWIAKVHKGVGMPNPGAKIYRCKDEFWQNAVVSAVKNCDAAIIDVSDLNENVLWEIEQCQRYLGVDKLICVYAVSLEEFPRDPGQDILHELSPIFRAQLEEVWFMPYPEPLPVKRGKARLDWELRETMDQYLEQTLEEIIGERTLFDM